MTTTMHQGLTEESFVEIGGETFYGIPDVDRMAPFLMSIISDSDHWLFVSSRGGLTAGRRDANSALFPYETDDRLHLAAGTTGPVTLIRPPAGGVWTPFQGRPGPEIRRNLYKSIVGNQVVFEEINPTLGLVFRYRWASSERFGFVRTASLLNQGGAAVSVEVLDGLLNILPHGLDPATYQAMSNLTHAYKRSELTQEDGRLAIFSLESLISDRAEPAEALTATVAWSYGMDGATVGLDQAAVDQFLSGGDVAEAALVTGRPGAYLLRSRVAVDAGDIAEWTIIADVARTHSHVAELVQFVESADPLPAVVESVANGTEALVSLLASADALQFTGDQMASVHHFANVAFNSMRGGVFASATRVHRDDFVEFLRMRNKPVADRHAEALMKLPAEIERRELLEDVHSTGDSQLSRLAIAYLPLTFSRRHGDPSRPWNAFSIRVRDDAGDPVVHYEGNWRDIFQNWEALCVSFPQYLPSVISLFLNASTPDGFNPYRITSQGIDWEKPEPDNPWSNIGYWGDHQIVYLQRLVDLVGRFEPSALVDMLGKAQFAYAATPYRIASYESIVRNPHATIAYDAAAADQVERQIASVGQDGELVTAADGDVLLVTMIEKLLVPSLAKISNLVPGGGIWMNTQRPEWNDANNALVGNGLSVVTACYLRMHLAGIASLLDRSPLRSVALSKEVADWAGAIAKVLADNLDYLEGELDDGRRREVIDALGGAFSDYRSQVYASGFTDISLVEISGLRTLLLNAVSHLDDTIRRNRRSDGLYHSYNLVHFSDRVPEVSVEHLDAMLEGQVAALGCGLLQADEKVALLDALFASGMYRPDQKSFMLYPPRALPAFSGKNIIPKSAVDGNELLTALVTARNTAVVRVDESGNHRFSATCKNHRALDAALDRLAEDDKWRDLVSKHRESVREVYEAVFNHHAYTGRSGSMYAYEGIGSIYWHMVAKLLLAVQESVRDASDAEVPEEMVARLVEHYWRVRSGLGFEQSAVGFGAFPMDPYSHTPAHAGAQQPGMTGQVKEEVLTRLLELGVRIDGGAITFDPLLLRAEEMLAEPAMWTMRDAADTERVIDLPAGALGMTLCQVPMIIVSGDVPSGRIDAYMADGTIHKVDGLSLDETTSAAVFQRLGTVLEIRAQVPKQAIQALTT